MGLGTTGDSVGGVAMARPWRTRVERCGHAARPVEQGRENRRLTGGPWPQCRAAAPADRQARVAQCRAARIQTGFKNISNGFKILQTMTDPKGVFTSSKNSK
jgi:hypothetical protein